MKIMFAVLSALKFVESPIKEWPEALGTAVKYNSHQILKKTKRHESVMQSIGCAYPHPVSKSIVNVMLKNYKNYLNFKKGSIVAYNFINGNLVFRF